VFVTGRDMGANAVPSIVLASEHYNLVAKMLQQKMPVKLAVEIQATYHEDDRNTHNVIWEIPGTDNAVKDEIVMVGAHLDSWHTATGATDNADGSAAVLEAMRILKATGVRPRRTIRVALWGAEEQGLRGSRAYVQQHLAGDANRVELERHVAYLNLDPGMGPIYGWYLENMDAVRTTFDRWLQPLTDLGARRNIAQGIGSTDHLSFKAVGVPGFNPVQDYVDYDVRTHHTNMDTAERVREEDVRQNAVVMAWFALQAANAAETLPRVPVTPSPPR
jgi:carboxypeptidase Q